MSKKRIYCQNCGDEITSRGAYVSKEGTFCLNKNARCIEEFTSKHGDFYFDYQTPQELQEIIKEQEKTENGKGINYQQLEIAKQLEYSLREIKEKFGDFPRQYSAKEKKGYICRGGYPSYIEGDELYLNRIRNFLHKKSLEKLL